MTLNKTKWTIFLLINVLLWSVETAKPGKEAKQSSRQKSKQKQSQNDVSDKSSENDNDGVGHNGNPGFRLRINKNGVDSITRTFGEIINELTPIMDVPEMEQEFNKGYVRMYNLHVQNFKPAEDFSTDLKSPNKIVWSMEDMNLGLKGDLEGEYNGQTANGQFDTLATGTNFIVTVLMIRDTEKNILKLDANDCKVTIKKFDFNVYNMGDRLQQLFSQYKNLVVNFLKPKVQDQLCKRIENMIDEKMNEQLATTGHFQPLSAATKLSQNQTVTMAPIPQQYQDILNNMYIDYSLVKDPVVNPKYIDLFSKGEVSAQGSGGTPFYPVTMNDPSSEITDRMIYVSISDYVLNSLLHNSFTHKLLNLKFNKDNAADMASFFRVNQCTELCLGAVFPELSKNYPDYDYEYQFNPSEAPTVTISNGKGKMLAKGIVTLVGKKDRTATEFLKHDFMVDADIRPYVDNSLIKGDLTVNDMKANLIKSQLQTVDQKRLNDLVKMSRLLLQSTANKSFKQGMPLPSADMVKLINPQLHLLDRHVRIETDIQLNKIAIVHKLGNGILAANNGR